MRPPLGPTIPLLLALGSPGEAFTAPRPVGTAGLGRTTAGAAGLTHGARQHPVAPSAASRRRRSPAASATALHAKKKKGGNKNKAKDAALAALDALEAQADGPAAGGGAATATLDWDDADEPLSKKEQMALEKKRQKEAKKAQSAAPPAAAAVDALPWDEEDEPLSKKEQMAL